jgi:hypothetical protein
MLDRMAKIKSMKKKAASGREFVVKKKRKEKRRMDEEREIEERYEASHWVYIQRPSMAKRVASQREGPAGGRHNGGKIDNGC